MVTSSLVTAAPTALPSGHELEGTKVMMMTNRKGIPKADSEKTSSVGRITTKQQKFGWYGYSRAKKLWLLGLQRL